MKTNYKDLTGQKFNKLTALGIDDCGTRKTYWFCLCECGNIKRVRSDSLQNGAIKSCGCLKKEQDRKNLTANHSHKMSGTRIYHTWAGMKSRCYNSLNKSYPNYGGRGIVICDEWKKDFSNFYDWSIKNGYTEELTIDRINVNGNYEPSNCRWATIKEQNNNRTSCIYLTIGNVTKNITQWCEFFNVDTKTVFARYQKNEDISIEDLFKPVKANTEVNG